MKILHLALHCTLLLHSYAQKISITEFHYDDISSDTSEFIEITATAGNLLGCYKLYLVNGAATTPVIYKTIHLKAATVSSDADVGVLLLDNGKQDQIQNGPNDGFLLYDSCHKKVVQYISYEGEIAPLIPYTNSRSKHIGVYEIAELDTTALFLQGNLQVRESQVWKKGRKTPALINPGLVTYNDAKATLTGTIFTEASMCLTPLPMQMSITLNQIGPDGILDTEDDVFFSVPTALDGSFIMRNLLPGTYMLYLNLPAGHAIDEDQPRPIILSGAATSIQQFCVHQVTTSQQESDIDAVTVAQQAGNIQVHTSPQMHRIVVYNHLGQAERHTCASFQTQMQGILQLEIVTEDGCYRRKIWVE